MASLKPAPTVKKKRVPAVGYCIWTRDEANVWWTGCGQAFQFTTDGPIENGFWFCGYCGGQLKTGKR